jgi:hypothetical protein
MGLVLAPLSIIVALPWQPFFFTAAAINFIPLLAPANVMTFDAQPFYNSALAILARIGAAMLACEWCRRHRPRHGPAGSSP